MKKNLVYKIVAFVAAVILMVLFIVPKVAKAESVSSVSNVEKHSFQGHDYAIINSPKCKTQEEIKKYAEDLGGHLAYIRSAEENDFIYGLIKAQPNNEKKSYYLLGIIRNKDNLNEWDYFDGTKVVYQNWSSGQPDYYHNNEIYVHMYTSNGKWNDIANNDSVAPVSGAVVEWDRDPELMYNCSDTVNVGEEISVDVKLNNINAASGIFTNMQFNPDALEYEGSTHPDSLKYDEIKEKDGVLTGVFNTKDASPIKDGVILTLKFKALPSQGASLLFGSTYLVKNGSIDRLNSDETLGKKIYIGIGIN